MRRSLRQRAKTGITTLFIYTLPPNKKMQYYHFILTLFSYFYDFILTLTGYDFVLIILFYFFYYFLVVAQILKLFNLLISLKSKLLHHN